MKDLALHVRRLGSLWMRLLTVAAACLLPWTSATAQTRPYIGYVYPAGGQQGTTFNIKLGGQGFDGVDQILVTGTGVTVRVIECNKALGNQEMTILTEQLKELKRPGTNGASPAKIKPVPQATSANTEDSMMMDGAKLAGSKYINTSTQLLAKIEKRLNEYVNRPASAALASIIYAEVTIAPDAPPGQRELRVAGPKSISNPLVFHVGQIPEVRRKAMIPASYQVLGKEELALRKRPTNEVEMRISLPCTVNGQVASGELNRYRFAAKKDQLLVITTQARQLIPYIADAVPGWFQPVIVLYDPTGRELAYDDDYRFKPDPTFSFKVPKDGDYSFVIYDSIFRGREDFVYRVSIGELPFVTSIYPLGAKVGEDVKITPKGWNIGAAEITPPRTDASAGIHYVTASQKKLISNPLPFALDTLPEIQEREVNNPQPRAQKVQLPVIINGRIERPDDWDIFQFQGHAGETIVAEVTARRLDSPLDSFLKLTDAAGKILALNDDWEDLGSGLNTHHADSYLMARLPTNGTYFIHLGDTSRSGGEEYGYRLRISTQQPDYALRVVPSSIAIRGGSTAALTVYAIRKDGFTNSIRLGLKNPPPGFSAQPISISGTQTMARLVIKADLKSTPEPISLCITGVSRLPHEVIAVPAEDRMQAFLWRHLVAASELKVLVYDPNYTPSPKRVAKARPPAPPAETQSATESTNSPPTKPKFSKQQVAGRLRQLKILFEEGLLTDDFYDEKVAECEAAK